MKACKKAALFVAIISVMFSFCGCDALLESVVDWIEENIRYEYEITASFEDESDTELFEARLEALGISVIESNGNGEYLLNSHYVLKDGFFDAVCSDSETAIVNELGSEIITCESISETTFDGVILELTLEKEFYESIAEEITETLYLSRGEYVYEVLTATEESENGVTVSFCEPYSEENGDSERLSGFEKAAITLVSTGANEPLRGSVNVTVDEIRVNDGKNE